jgi:hypothetical protein
VTTRRPPSFRPAHIAVLAYVLERPGASNANIAEATGYTRWHVSRILNSWEFRTRLWSIQRERMVMLGEGRSTESD